LISISKEWRRERLEEWNKGGRANPMCPLKITTIMDSRDSDLVESWKESCMQNALKIIPCLRQQGRAFFHRFLSLLGKIGLIDY
jgi:hypothetical protein